MQSTPIGMGRTAESRIDGHQLGKSRTGPFNALSALAYGSDIPFGRLVVFSPVYNQAVANSADVPTRSVMLPSEDGEYLINPADGTLLTATANAALVTASKYLPEGAAAGEEIYRVAGITMEGDRCESGYCDQPPLWPVGDHDNLYELQYSQHRRPLTYGTHGYFRVRIGEDLQPGDALAFSDTVDDADPNVGVRTIGSLVKAGNGVQDLPTSWQVVSGGRAGQTAEIYIGG